MSDDTLPTVRLGSLCEGDSKFHEIGPADKFGFTWLGDQTSQKRLDLTPRQDSYQDHLSVHVTLASEETDSSRSNDHNHEDSGVPDPSDTSRSSSHLGASLPRLSRAFSMPSTSQIGHWQHPSRRNTEIHAFDEKPTSADQHFQELALELADSVQMAIQTLLQLSPPQLFDAAKEQFSACALQIPTTSFCALLTSMKNLNYISANMHTVCLDVDPRQDSLVKDEFDIGEVLQSVGDTLGGIAAEAEVDLVLHHGDVIKHMGVRGDECGVSYALSHIIQQVLLTARRGDSLEIGLAITGQSIPGYHSSSASSFSSTSSSASGDSPPIQAEGAVVCTFDVAHKFTTYSAPSEGSSDEPHLLESDSDARPPDLIETRPEPQFESRLLRCLLKLIGGTLRTSLEPKSFPKGRRCELSVTLERGPPLAVLDERTPPAEDDMYRQPPSDIRLAREPSIEELTGFAETLRGKRVAFHASSQGSFAHHLTRYLTAWGMDISHVPTDGLEETDPADGPLNVHMLSEFRNLTSSPGVGISDSENVPPIVDSSSDAASDHKPASSEMGLSLIIIDDDVQCLRRRLLQHRAETMPNLPLHPRKRPSLAAHHRPRSSPCMRNNLLSVGAQQQPSPPRPFPCLANYKLVKDAIQAMILGVEPLPLVPEVIVIPKPAGPRRILTALHTAIHKPLVDPFFSPIATSPLSPCGTVPPLITGRKSTSASNLPSGVRIGTERFARAGSDSAATIPPPSPLSIAEGYEYFSDAAVKTLGGNAASGLVIQSPDGRPAGIFFQPQSRVPSSRGELTVPTMERERTTLRPVSQRVSRKHSSRKPGADSTADMADTSREETSAHSSSSKASLALSPARLSFSSTASPCPGRPRLDDQPDLRKPFKGKGRVRTDTVDQEESRALSSAAWKEATQNLAKQPGTRLTPLDSNPEAAVTISVTHSARADSTSPVLMSSNSGLPARSSTSCTTVTRRTAQGPKSPVISTNLKKPKTVGNNIVPPISVLIVEDNAINQTILSTFMRRNKIKYEVAWNGREAVEKWRNGNFHLILMDIQMPVMDGIEATKEIRRLEKAENIGNFPSSPGESARRSASTPDSRPSSAASTPFRSQVIIVALTASSLQSDRVAALAAGCNDFLTKPVTNSWLNDKIIEWGSIKALQMWAELRPEIAKNLSHDQAVQAQAVANNLHVPIGSARGSPLRGVHNPILPNDSESRVAEEAEDGSRMFRSTRPTGAKAAHRSSTGSLSSDSSPERWPLSSDDDFAQDPITEPPAVIETPVRSTIALPPLENEPAQVSGETALLHFLEDSKQDSQLPRPALLGNRVISSAMPSTSIAAILHDTPGVGDTKTDDNGMVSDSQENSSTGQDDPPGH
ncbi:hypothetical protein JB92DRAFT_2909811 [Gautieria morchelliformis]|nr:hypothetical protein JB92DRAFT_2909811 [Gautieria morchelliformis]